MKLPSVVAGSFYPSQPKVLTKLLDGYAKELHPMELPGQAVGMILPHAGYAYSGPVAALGYLSLTEQYEFIIVAGPSHFVPFQGASIFAGESVQTPLGDLAVDQEAAQALMVSHESLREFPAAWEREHSVEVHFPLIKKFLPKTKVVPIVTGHCVGRYSEALAGALAKLGRTRKFLFVASSDLSHYPDYATASTKDQEFLKAVLTGDPDQVDQADNRILGEHHPNLQCTHCGSEPVQAILQYGKVTGAKNIRLMKYQNSGDVTKDKSRVVGYAAVAFCR